MGFMDRIRNMKEKMNLDDKSMAELRRRKTHHRDEQIDKD